jgi:hypothetical protein
MLLGVQLTLLIGPTVAVPAPPPLTEALVGVEVTHSDQGKSGFQLTFQVGRAGLADILDYSLLLNPLLRPFNRVILTVLFNAFPKVLMDGFITAQQLTPSNEPGGSTLTVTGEDVSVMMDLDQKTAEHVGQPESVIAFMILGRYMQYLAMPPVIIPPTSLDVPLPTDRIPVQRDTDLNYLNTLAGRFGHVFYVTPGPAPFQNTAYWGPPDRLAIPQPAISVNMGPATNVESISFQYNALAPTMVLDVLQDSTLNQSLPVITFASTRIPPLALMPALPFNLPNVRKSLLDQQGGLTIAQAYARAQAKTNASTDTVVTATGTLDAMQYGDLLTPRGIVGLRGAGFTYDGLYYVKSVTHSIKKGDYKQRFTLTREGTGSLVPFVRP